MKKDIPPDINEEDAVEEQAEEKSEKKQVISKGIPAELNVILERIQTQIQALNEVREVGNERFARISEQIGELRTMVIDNEKNMHEIEIKATMASDAVKEVKPETISADVSKMNTKFEMLNAKIEANKSFTESIVDEIKEMKRRLELFKGTEAIIKLNEDTKKEILGVQKIKSLIDGHANKIEQIYLTIQKNFGDFQKAQSQIDDVSSANSKLQNEINTIRVRLETLSTKKEIEALRKGINYNSKELEKNKNIISLIKSIEIKLADLIRNNKNDIIDLRKSNEKLKRNIEDIYEFLEKLTKNMSKKVPDKRIETLEDETEKQAKRLTDLLEVIEKLESKIMQPPKKYQDKKR